MWQDISTAPKDGTVVLVYGFSESDYVDLEDGEPGITRSTYPAYVSIQKHIWWLAGELYQIRLPTHWMPLPAPPTETIAEREKEG